MNNSIYQQTMHNLKVLRLIQMQLHLESIAAKVSTEKLSFTEGLLKLTNYEVDFKENSATQNMVHAAAFPFIKTLLTLTSVFSHLSVKHRCRSFVL